jgi:6-phospho-3-hexuloisomerase
MNTDIKNIIKELSEEVSEVCSKIEEKELETIANYIDDSNNIFIYGNGRSGLVGKMFGMRLMHSGYNVFIVGETNTPSFTGKDLVIILSGSGKSEAINNMISKVRNIGGSSALVTASQDTSVKQLCDTTLHLRASTKQNDIKTIQPLGNQFDQSLHLVLDGIIIYLNKKNKKRNEELKSMHFNLE